MLREKFPRIFLLASTVNKVYDAECLGGGGARSRSRIAGSGGRASLRPAATSRVADGGGPMKTNEGPGSIYLHVRHIALKIKMRVCKYYYSNYVLE